MMPAVKKKKEEITNLVDGLGAPRSLLLLHLYPARLARRNAIPLSLGVVREQLRRGDFLTVEEDARRAVPDDVLNELEQTGVRTVLAVPVDIAIYLCESNNV